MQWELVHLSTFNSFLSATLFCFSLFILVGWVQSYFQAIFSQGRFFKVQKFRLHSWICVLLTVLKTLIFILGGVPTKSHSPAEWTTGILLSATSVVNKKGEKPLSLLRKYPETNCWSSEAVKLFESSLKCQAKYHYEYQ